MKLQIVGCSHHTAPLEIRERLAFGPSQVPLALTRWRDRFPDAEAVLLSTCNRVELFVANENLDGGPTHHEVVDFLADFHGLNAVEIFDWLFERSGEDAVRHLFSVASSLDSMVVGEPQILAQVKQAYSLAIHGRSDGPLTHAAFQAAIRVAKRVATETAIQRRRVSIPSVAILDFATQIYERFDNKRVLVIGAGEMAEETLRYLADAGAQDFTVVNRSMDRGQQLADQFGGKAASFDERLQYLVHADLVVSATGHGKPVVLLSEFESVQQQRNQKPLFILDLAVPRDIDPAIGDCLGVYLYAIDDLQQACQRNRLAREKEWPVAEGILDQETARFMSDLHHRATGPTIKRLKARADEIKDEELKRLFNKLQQGDADSQAEISRSFERLINKLLHPPLESLRDASEEGTPHGLLDALRKLFQLKD
ncbi:MAG: glutamyl-tRNA reductase [Pirellulaceae bacterium]|nr:glutamyl-tRNA reductase [Pirellulaceae bacterium]